ncbi:MAG: Adenylate kinase [uncultured bacterium (gcode 4)]|uniref:Adenylate kinase n=1 Tax=uncultured bacterium (gcode 4) TaxID=1234023 RepID=K2G3Q7_9BACT|nr:MAG: Adenylate kinase [uncultured bacterium (gcode 4)]
MNIVLVWIQWSGKGTQARLIEEKYSYNFFEMWQKLRNFCELWLPESAQVKELVTAWKLVPTELIWRILKHYRDSHSENFILFDGIPRSIEQKEIFEMIIGEYVVFYLDLSKDLAIKRLSWRRIDPKTWESFWPDFAWDTNPATWNELITRADDTPDAVKKRVDTFYLNTLPLISAWTDESRKIYEIDASKSVEKVFEQISDIIENKFYTSVE